MPGWTTSHPMNANKLMKFALASATAGLAIFAVQRFLMKVPGTDGPGATNIIEPSDGYGVDDIAQGAAVVGGLHLLKHLTKGKAA